MKRILFYLLVLIAFGLGLSFTLNQGRKLSATPDLRSNVANQAGLAGVEPSASLLTNLRENFQDPLTRLFVQLNLVVLVARLCGMLATKVRPPAVVGEMIAGILLGPSLLGLVWPGAFQFIFSPRWPGRIPPL